MEHPKDALIAATFTVAALFNQAHPHDVKHEPHLPESSFSTDVSGPVLTTFAVGSNMSMRVVTRIAVLIDDDF